VGFLSSLFVGSARLARAAANSPPLRRGEPDRDAVQLLQMGLTLLGFPLPRSFPQGPANLPDGIYGDETVGAVRAFQQKQFPNDPVQWDGTAGMLTLSRLDQLLVSNGPAVQTFPADLRVLWQPTRASLTQGLGLNQLFYLIKALELLKPFGMGVVSSFLIPDTAVPNDDVVDPRFDDDAFKVRRDAETQRPGHPNALRILICPFVSSSPEVGFTQDGSVRSPSFPDFILLNARKLCKDHCTLLHEMIHATGLEKHDTDPQSVFFGECSNRSVLPVLHAQRLSKSFFATPKTP
jgi:hypothetical protein